MLHRLLVKIKNGKVGVILNNLRRKKPHVVLTKS